VTTPSAGELAGFEAADVTTQRPPRFEGKVEFEVRPSEVRPGQPFMVHVHLVNEGRREARLEGVEITTVADGRRTVAPAPLLREKVRPRDRALVAEYSGVWSEVDAWSLEAVVAMEGNERVRSRLRSERTE
jgi:hypothetical protein